MGNEVAMRNFIDTFQMRKESKGRDLDNRELFPIWISSFFTHIPLLVTNQIIFRTIKEPKYWTTSD